MVEEMSRREFVRMGAVVGAVVAVAGASGCAPARTQAPVATPSLRLGKETGMAGRVMVGYATRTGSTVDVAEAIGRGLAERGFAVDVLPLREDPSPEGYDAVVLGSAINGAQWLPEAMSWLRANAGALERVPAAVFCVHSMNGGADEGQTRKRLAYLDPVRALLRPRAEGFFLGKGPSEEDSSLIERWAFKAFGGTAEGDARDWDAIAVWAEEVAL